MRLIDADALINRVVFHTDWSLDEKAAFEDEVNAEPTIESERKTGKWISQVGGGCCCSKCGRYALHDVDEKFALLFTKSKYCPNCGAKMSTD